MRTNGQAYSMGVAVGGAVVGGCVGAVVVGAAVVGGCVVTGGVVVVGVSPGPVVVPSSIGASLCEGEVVWGGAVVVSPDDDMHPEISVIRRRMQSMVARYDFMYTLLSNGLL